MRVPIWLSLLALRFIRMSASMTRRRVSPAAPKRVTLRGKEHDVHLEYSQSTGFLGLYDKAEVVDEWTCYAGGGDGFNNPDAEHLSGVGPLPRGCYRVGIPFRHKRLGPLAFRLDHRDGATYGRTGFLIHGDNRRGDRSASSGCIIAPRAAREMIAAARPGLLLVDR